MMYAKPDFSNLSIVSACMYDTSTIQNADFDNTAISRNEWIASMDTNENNAWQTLHIETPTVEHFRLSILAKLFTLLS